MGLISPGGENLLDFLELWHVLSTYDGDLTLQFPFPHNGRNVLPQELALANGMWANVTYTPSLQRY